MTTVKLVTYAMLGVIAGLLIENKSLRLRRKAQLKLAAMKKRMHED